MDRGTGGESAWFINDDGKSIEVFAITRGATNETINSTINNERHGHFNYGLELPISLATNGTARAVSALMHASSYGLLVF